MLDNVGVNSLVGYGVLPINSIGASRALCLNVTYSFWAVIFGLFILGGEFSFNVVIGSIVIVLGVIVATVVSKPKCSTA